MIDSGYTAWGARLSLHISRADHLRLTKNVQLTAANDLKSAPTHEEPPEDEGSKHPSPLQATARRTAQNRTGR
jgi:hypothetical protein